MHCTCVAAMVALAVCFILLGLSGTASSAMIVPEDHPTFWEYHGDLNVGFLLNIQSRGDGQSLCQGNPSLYSVQRNELIYKSVLDVNARDDLLPNVTLGFIILDACKASRGAVARSTYFIRDTPTCDKSNMSCPTGERPSPRELFLTQVQVHFDVVGIVGPGWSSEAVPVASLYDVFEIPILSESATSDELSDKTRFKFFSRVCPPDRFLADAIVDLLFHFEWSYVIVLYSEGNYGENLAKQLEKKLKGTGVCFAKFHRISSTANNQEFDQLTDELGEEKTARVIISFMEGSHIGDVMNSLRPKLTKNRFIYLGGDWFGGVYSEPHADMAEGSMFLNTLPVEIPDFEAFFLNRRPWDEPVNPLFLPIWENIFGCSWSVNKPDNSSCYSYEDIRQWVGYTDLVPGASARYTDAVLVYANALHKLLTDHCPGAFENPNIARSCVNGELLLRYLRDTEIDGLSGVIRFDEYGDRLAKYAIHQIRKDTSGDGYRKVFVGEWDVFAAPDERLLVLNDSLDFSGVMQESVAETGPFRALKSVCSEPCPPRHSLAREDTPCCWQCYKCRSNEILVRNGTNCARCDPNKWPDDDAGLECVPIKTTFLQWSSPIAIALLLVATLCILMSIVVVVVFYRNRDHKLVRATSRGLSNFILAGTTLASIDVFLVVCPPTRAICVIRRAAFHLGVTLMYAPLLIKTVRIYRVFVNSLRGLQKVKFVSANLQLMIACVVVCIQVVVLGVSESYLPSVPHITMPVSTEKYTEQVCYQDLVGFILPLSYNVLIIFICAILGYLSRKLPQNFNESWFIFIMVSTTLFMWTVFLPTYFTAFYAYYKSVFFALCLILNALITLGTLFVPRVYAVYCVNLDNMMFSTMTVNTATVSATGSAMYSGQQEKPSSQ